MFERLPLVSKLAALGIITMLAMAVGVSTARPAQAAGLPISMTLSVGASSIACNSSTSVTAQITGQTGFPADPSSVTFTATQGTVTSPVMSAGGVAGATFTAPANFTGTVTISASTPGAGGNITATASVSVNCGGNTGCTYPYNSGCNTCSYPYNTGCGNYGGCGTYTNVNCGGGCGVFYGSNCGYSGCASYGGNYAGNYGGYGGYGGGCFNNCGGGTLNYSSCVTGCSGYNYGCGGGGCQYAGCGTACSSYGGCVATCVTTTCHDTCVPYGAVFAGCPGLASGINILAPTSVVCGSASDITAVVTDYNGYRVADGTVVTFATSLGSVTPTSYSSGGQAISSLNVDPRTSGAAQVTVSVNGQTKTASVTVNCSISAPVVSPVQIQIPQVILPPIIAPRTGEGPVFRPPNTGDAGLRSIVADCTDE